MSREGTPQAKPQPAIAPSAPKNTPEPAPVPAPQPKAPGNVFKELIDREAVALFNGTTTMAKLLDVYDEYTVREIIKRNNQLDSDSSKYNEPKKIESVLEIPKASQIISIMHEYKKLPRTNIAEENFVDLLEKLKKSPDFKMLLDSYKKLIDQDVNATEIYEAKAVQDFLEFYPELVN